MNQTEELRDLLYDKVKAEYDQFLDGLKTLPVEEVIQKSYEKVFKEDILLTFEESEHFSDEQLKALLKTSNTLDACYTAWLKQDYTYMDMLSDTIGDYAENRVKEIVKAQKKKSEPER